jgi:dTDP-4-amino-4,6-dideoxygalactose transaminase
VIEDAAQMPGARIEGRRAGTWGDIGTISFGGSKLLTAGRGGAIVTRNRELHHRAKLASHRGNQVYPLSELQAAVLLPQLEKLDGRNRVRAENVRVLCEAIADLPGLCPFRNGVNDTEPGYYKLGFQFDPAAFGLSRDRFVESVRAEGVAMDVGFRSLHAGRSGSRFRSAGELAEAERAHHGAVVLHHPVLLGSPADIDEIARALRKIYSFRDELQSVAPFEEERAAADELD